MNNWLNSGRGLFLSLAVAWGMALSGVQAAERNDIFMISNVAVDITAGSAAEARARAMQQGQLDAYDILMRRLLAEEDWPRAPRMDAVALGHLVGSLEISEERSSPVRYMATLSVQFYPQSIRDLLKNSGLAFTQTMAPSVLVVPFMQYLGADYLWQDGNPWRAAWQAHDLENRLAPYAVARGDAMDRLMAPPFEVLAASSNMLRRLSGRYETEGALVAVLNLEPGMDGEGFLADVRLLSDGGEELVLEDVAVAAAAPGDMSAGPAAEMLAPLVEAVVAARDANWKATTLVRMDQGGEVALLAPLRGLKNWTEMQRRLDRLNLVEKVSLERLNTKEARLAVRYVGAWESLTVAMEGAGLKLHPQGGEWTLYLAEAAPKTALQPTVPAASDNEPPDSGWVDVGEPAPESR